MGIQLDWQIQADQTQQRDQEDPENRRRRRRNRFRMVVIALLLAAVLAVVGMLVILRLQAVGQRAENDLRAVVEAELVALRIGDEEAFLAVHRTTNEPWLERQRGFFDEYQSLKETGRVQPDSEIMNVEIDDQRGRVLVRQTVDRVPQQQVWFYWQYEDLVENNDERGGWRRVPPDVTFWGDEQTLENDASRVVYYELDADLAEVLAPRVDAWWVEGCQWLGCASAPPDLELIIDPQAGIRLAWEPQDGWRLRMVSPFLSGRVPQTDDLPPSVAGDLARALAERLINYASQGRIIYAAEADASINFDMDWVYYQLRDWLMGRYIGTSAPFMESLVASFGDTIPARIATTPSNSRQINALAPMLVPGASGLMSLDVATLQAIQWGPFFEWRLRLERERLLSEDLDSFFALYEQGNFNDAANARAFDMAYRASAPEQVVGVTFSARADGQPVAVLQVQDATGTPAQISFAWMGDTFLRVN